MGHAATGRAGACTQAPDLWTWTSTQMPALSFQATFMMRYAILGPMPGSAVRPSTERGMSPPCSSRSTLHAARRYFACSGGGRERGGEASCVRAQ